MHENVADKDFRFLEEYYTKNPAVEKDGRFNGITQGMRKKRK
jgi:hypothetical protein